MSAIAFSPLEGRLHPSLSHQYPPSSTPTAFESVATDRRMSSANETTMAFPTVLLRRLPRNTTAEAVRTMLLFAKDLHDTEIVPTEYEEDNGFTTAIARFASLTGATEAQSMLNGKPNTAGQAKMIVDVIASPLLASAPRRNTIDPMTNRKLAQSTSPLAVNGQKSSRFNGTFQALDSKTSPPLLASPPDHPSSETSSHLQTIFSPQSPVNSAVTDRSRASGKQVIDEDGGDDDTRELLKDPLAFMHSSGVGANAGRKSGNGRPPTSAFSALSLNTSMNNGSSKNYGSPRSSVQGRGNHHQFSPNAAPNGPYSSAGPSYIRHNYPPVNPADQNPPCNTLYVGNLPIDTSEDELKAMFSKQRGYKRLCFRTKQNGPMCFVEFEDISFATKALNELYGAQLHNSVKGGIRLSFSKNPLGVRTGQAGGGNPISPLSATGPVGINGFSNAVSPGNYASANGPPPGLSMPPGLNAAMNGVGPGPDAYSGAGPNGHFVNQALRMHGMAVNHGHGGPSLGGNYPDYMLGR